MFVKTGNISHTLVMKPKAFSTTELLVVLFVIMILLGIALAGYQYINSSSHLSNAVYKVRGALAHARTLSERLHGTTAVRFLPTRWANGTDSDSQSIIVYHWICSTDDKEDLDKIIYDEHFERAIDIGITELPRSVWVAPTAVLTDPNLATGTIYVFDPNNSLPIDDFVVIFDDGAVYDWPVPEDLRFYDYNPDTKQMDFFQRTNKVDLIFYQRKPVTELGLDARAADRQFLIERLGETYVIEKSSAKLQKQIN